MTVLRLGQISDKNLPIILIMDWFIDRLRNSPMQINQHKTVHTVYRQQLCSIVRVLDFVGLITSLALSLKLVEYM
jgi:hypothetical protein